MQLSLFSGLLVLQKVPLEDGHFKRRVPVWGKSLFWAGSCEWAREIHDLRFEWKTGYERRRLAWYRNCRMHSFPSPISVLCALGPDFPPEIEDFLLALEWESLNPSNNSKSYLEFCLDHSTSFFVTRPSSQHKVECPPVRLALSQQREEPRMNMRLCAALQLSPNTFSRPTTFSSLGNHLTLNSFPR